MSIEPNSIEEIMAKIDAIQNEADSVEASKEKKITSSGSVVDEDLFDQIKEKKTAEEQSKSKSVIRRFIDGDEDEIDESEIAPVYSEPIVAPEDIEDFEEEDDRDEIYRDLKNIVGKMAVKSVFLLSLTLASLYLFVAGFFPVLFGGDVDNIWFRLCFLAVDVLAVIFSFGIFTEGLSRLIRARADTDTLLALFWLSLIVVRVAGLIKPELIPFQLNLEPMLTVGLWLNVLAKKKIASNIKKNFRYVACSTDKLTVTVPSSCETNNALILETGEGGDIMYAHPTGLVSQFIENSYCDFSWDRPIEHFLFATVPAILVGVILIWQLVGAGAALVFPAAAFAISVPFFSRYHYALSIAQNGKKIRKNGGILTSARSAKALEDSDLLMISEEDFLGSDKVLLQGVKAMGDSQIDDLITHIAALFYEVGTPLKPLFMKMIDEKSVKLPRADDIYYHEGMGYSCLIHSKLFLVGNKHLMEHFNIEFPQQLFELQLKEGHYPVYVAYQKQPAGIFITSFEYNSETAAAIKLAEEERLEVGIVSHDFLFSSELLNKMYSISHPDLFHFISTKTGALCRPFLKRTDKSPDLIASCSGPQGLISCLLGSSKLLSALKINGVIRVLYTVLALSLIFFIALSGYSADTALHILAFQAIWMIPVCAICTFCK